MEKKWIDVIEKCDVFKDIDKNEIINVLKCLNFKVSKFSKGEIIGIEGNKFEGVGVVLEGEVCILKENFSGNKTILGIFKESEIFGETVAFSGAGLWPATVVSKSNAIIMFIHPENILASCSNNCVSHKKMISNMIKLISNKALMLNRKVEYLTIKSMKGKISKYLLEIYKKTKSLTFSIPLNRGELSDFLNVSRPSMSRELGKMRDDGIIEFYKETIRIINLEELSKMMEN